MFNIVLVHPQIPQNTGNIARLTAANYSSLHLVRPMAFEITDAKVKRAGLDYWPEVLLSQYGNWGEFLQSTNANTEQLWFFTTKATKLYYHAEFRKGDFLIFGSETNGLPKDMHTRYSDRRLTLPMQNPNIRSLNLANSVSAALYEAIRQNLSSIKILR